MFSWICARCGRDNPPSAVNCVSCGLPFDAPAEQPATPPDAAPELPPPASAAPKTVLPPSVPQRAKTGLPTWLLTILFFFAIVGIGSGIYFAITYVGTRKAATSTGLDPAANVARTKLASPLQKVVEVVGIRLVLDARKKPQARFVVVNHSPNQLDALSATVTIWASTSRSEEDSVGTFTFNISALNAYESKDLTAPLNTKLKIYELPDWQNVNPEVTFTTP